MTTQPDDQSMIARIKDDGEPVGAADTAEDARRAGAGPDDEWRRQTVMDGAIENDDPDRATDQGVPVGEADAEADRDRAFGDGDRD